jgi:hypothetical protein
MSRKALFIGGTGILVVVLTLLMVDQGDALNRFARLHNYSTIITIFGSWEGGRAVTRLKPKELCIDRGTTVIWLNEAKAEVKIQFGEGTECKEVSSAAIRWNLGSHKCLVTRDATPPGGVIRVRFNDPGRYEYEVIYVGKNRKEKGVIGVVTPPGY